MHFLPTAMVALASLMTGALALPGAVVADSANLPSRDLIPLQSSPPQHPMDPYLDTTFAVCNYDLWHSHPCPENEILEARDILRQRCGLHGAWLIHDKPEGKTYTYDGAPTMVCDNMWGPFGKMSRNTTTTTNKDGVVCNTITFAAEDVEY